MTPGVEAKPIEAVHARRVGDVADGARDIEAAVQWAISFTGNLPWRNPTDDDLALDHGWTCVPKATRGLYRQSGGLLLKASGGISGDAAIIVAEIKALPARMAALVIDHAREQSRPNPLVGVIPERIERTVSWRKAKRKRGRKAGHRPVKQLVWFPCSPEAICAAREDYTLWHEGLNRLVATLSGKLTYCRISGFFASSRPWE